MLATKRSIGITQEMNLREHVTCMPPPSMNKAAHSGFKTERRCHQKSKTGVTVAAQKGLMSYKIFLKKNYQTPKINLNYFLACSKIPYESHVFADLNITTTSAIDFANASSTFDKECKRKC